MLKSRLVGFAKSIPIVRSSVIAMRQLRLAWSCAVFDWRQQRQFMRWSEGDKDYGRLSAQLIFYYHKIEKGLCLPGRRFFGLDAINNTVAVMDRWNNAGLPHSPVYRAAQATLHAYRIRLEETPPREEHRDELGAKLDRVLSDFAPMPSELTPIRDRNHDLDAWSVLDNLARQRRSVRHFDSRPVDFELVQKAVQVGQLSPSACNRQPWRIHFFDQRDDIDRLLKLQNGNSGFGNTIPLLALIAADTSYFFDETERGEPGLDGGLFLMSFILALKAQGISSCCLNWCVTPATDISMRRISRIPANERVLTYLAIGHAAPDIDVPLSARRPLDDIVIRH